MHLLGIPMFIVVVACSITMGALWSILFAFVALIPYSFFYSRHTLWWPRAIHRRLAGGSTLAWFWYNLPSSQYWWLARGPNISFKADGFAAA